jgi:hypothetical protein
MNYYISKVPSRSVDHLTAAIPGAVVLEDRGLGAMKAFAWYLQCAGNGAHVRLEDDISLCSRFVEKCEAAIARYPSSMISFFTLKKLEASKFVNGSTFCMNQCVYMPAGLAPAILRFYEAGWMDDPSGYDYMMADYLTSVGKKYLLWYPNLVQHQQVKSAIDPRRSKFRQSKCFDLSE